MITAPIVMRAALCAAFRRGGAVVTDIARLGAIADFRDDLARARGDLEAAIADIVSDVDVDEILWKEPDGVIRVSKTLLNNLLERLADAPESVTGADWQTRKALQTLQQALTRETVEG
jgi:hypothetical protein